MLFVATHKLHNYLRTYRKRTGLSQTEVAFLLGCQSGAKVSRYECFARQPGLQTAFAYAVIFRATARELFGGVFQQVEKKTIQRAQVLASKLEQAIPNKKTSQKLKVLRAIISSSETKLGKKE